MKKIKNNIAQSQNYRQKKKVIEKFEQNFYQIFCENFFNKSGT